MKPPTTYFAQVPEWVLFVASPTAVKLYGVLDRIADRTDEAFPNHATLAERMDASDSTVRRAIRELEALGALERWRRYRDDGQGQTSNGYRLLRDPPDLTLPLVTDDQGGVVIDDQGKNQSQNEPEEEPLPSVEALPAKRSKRKADPLWDALVEVLGVSPETKTERGRWNAALREIREAGGTADDIILRSKEYRKLWPGVSLTATALSANWGSLRAGVEKQAKAKAQTCPSCGTGGGHHERDCPDVGKPE